MLASKKVPEKSSPAVPLPDVCMRTPNGKPISVDYEVMYMLSVALEVVQVLLDASVIPEVLPFFIVCQTNFLSG